MADPFTIAVAGYVAGNIPHWLEDLRSNLLTKGKELSVKKGKDWLSEKEQQRRLQQVLKKALKRGLATFQIAQERDQYKDILSNLFEPGEHSDNMRREAMGLFSLSGAPNVAQLNEVYNRSLRIRSLSQSMPPAKVDAAPYLISFFEALVSELYADSFFSRQISDVIQARAAIMLPQYMSETNKILQKIHGAIEDNYKEEQFQNDMMTYIEYMERTLRNLKIIGFVSKDQNRDPELDSIFVPMRIALTDSTIIIDKDQHSLVPLLEQYHSMVLLGEPGSGKSTIARYLSWSHAKANLTQHDLPSFSFLSGCPLPLRIELRLLTQDRKQHPSHSFLSYAVEVLLRRDNINVSPLLFENLLIQKRMLVLFDGLDEVTTLDERQRLVQEIENFARLYSGNYFLITSRPVGYELASCSKQLFTHAKVQNFDDDQIHQFLERWYKYVLRLIPLPYQEQQELEALFNTLKENTRLHKLAENPLLLTVITGLYRSQRLPEKRVQVYDKCAELLLETWANLKGTNIRWANMKMSKEDQFACVAHLGFQLHKRSQEEKSPQLHNSSMETATDVPSRLILREIESFLSNGKLIVEVAEQHKEAKLFLNLMREEAGLIVERGTEESGENIYGFVHRTFQEYFAASDVYERYKQDEDPAIISDFLEEHMHDPHWSEVILLLLGKLGRKPVTVRLRQILEGKIKNHRSYYNSIIQQDFYFVCDCLVEEIAIESDLAEYVVTYLSSLATSSLFLTQRVDALEMLGKLMQVKQLAALAKRELIKFMILNAKMDLTWHIKIASTLFRYASLDSEERKQATQILLSLAQRPGLTIEQTMQVTYEFFRYASLDSEERKQATQILLSLVQRPGFTIEQIIQVMRRFFRYTSLDSEEWKQATQILLSLAQRPDLTIEQIIQVMQELYMFSLFGSEESKQATQVLLSLAQRPDLTIEQNIQAAQALCDVDTPALEDWKQTAQILLSLAQRPDLTIEQNIQAAQALYESDHPNYEANNSDSEDWKQAAQILLSLAQRPDLTIEQNIQAAQVLYSSDDFILEEEEQVVQVLLSLVQRPDLTIEQVIQVTQVLYLSSPVGSEEEEQAAQVLLSLVQRSDLTIEQAIQAAQVLYGGSSIDSGEREQAVQWLLQLEQCEAITEDQYLNIIAIPWIEWRASYIDKVISVKKLLALPLSENVMSVLQEKLNFRTNNISPKEIPSIVEIINQDSLPLNLREELYDILKDLVPQFHKLLSV